MRSRSQRPSNAIFRPIRWTKNIRWLKKKCLTSNWLTSNWLTSNWSSVPAAADPEWRSVARFDWDGPHCATRRTGAGLVLEQAGDGAFLEDRGDRLCEQGRDRQHLEFVEMAVVGDRQRVGHDDLGCRRVLQPVDGGAGEYGVRGGDDDLGSTIGDERLGGLHDRAAGVDEVVDEYAPVSYTHLTLP